jgi:Transcriptional regulators
MSVTIKDIAQKARVSYATVSRALSDHPEIKDETKQLVREIAKEMGYAPNAIAKGLVTKNTYTIGLLIPDITNPFFPEVAQGIEHCANKNGYKVFLCNSNWDMQKEKEYLDILYGSRVDGIVVAPVSDDITHILEIGKSIPVVFAAYKPRYEGCNYVVTDDFSSATIAVDYLIKLGHVKIAYLGGLQNNSTNSGRFTGYKETLGKNGINMNPDYIKFGQYKQESGYLLTRDMLLHNDLPTAILAGNDIIALGVIQAIEEFGLEVPNDISVIGFDDISFARLDKIQLTTVYQPKYQIGQLCVEILLEKKNKGGNSEALQKIINPELIIRKTCRKV